MHALFNYNNKQTCKKPMKPLSLCVFRSVLNLFAKEIHSNALLLLLHHLCTLFSDTNENIFTSSSSSFDINIPSTYLPLVIRCRLTQYVQLNHWLVGLIISECILLLHATCRWYHPSMITPVDIEVLL